MVRYSPAPKPTARQLRFLRLMYPTGSVAVGLDVGSTMLRYGLVEIGRAGRYVLTEQGKHAVCSALQKPRRLPASSHEDATQAISES